MIHPVVYGYLMPTPGQGGNGAIVIVQIVLLLGIFWFLLIRPQRQQQKQHEELLKGIKKGDEVITSGGIVGRVVHQKDDRVTIESGESRLVIERAKITTVVQPKPAEEPAQK